MPSISVLPQTVADQIAAGEVVERPASVVKELIENSVDAGATAIEVAIEHGGRSLIRVSDDGIGMDRDDALLALARHGTSKIRSAHELQAIATFGFRGEALPAICSVSRMEIVTAPRDGEGTRVQSDGGAEPKIEQASRRRGTTVSVSQLFFNVPARLSFMRGARSEWRAIVESLTSLALARRDIRVTVSHDGKQVLALPPAPSLRARLAALWGAEFASRLVEVDDVQGPIRVAGLVERPSDVGTATRRVFISVNGRAIRDPGFVRAAETAYRSTIPAGTRPSLFLDVTLPADMVDVNVHPAKAEVRFKDRWSTERIVEGAVRRALGTVGSAAAFGARFVPTLAASSALASVDDSVLMPRNTNDGPLFAGSSGGDVATDAVGAGVDDDIDVDDRAQTRATVVDSGIPPLLQLRRTYMMFEHEEGVVLIDQHSAHERVLYEEFMTALESGAMSSQRLLIPLTLHLGPSEASAFEENRDYFERIGFEAESFGGNTLLVNSVPHPHPRFDAERCLRESLEALTGNRIAATAARHERLAATVACKAAVKAGDPLSQDEMRALFVALRETKLPAHDVHGRSTIVYLPWGEVERRFGRA